MEEDFYEMFGVEVKPMGNEYVNYHKHSGASSIKQPDSFVDMSEYIEKAKQLGHNTISTCEHGSAGDVLKVYDLCKKNNMKFLFANEIYFKYDIEEKRAGHLILIARNLNGMHEINKAQAKAIKERGGYWGIEHLKQLTPCNVYVTTACLASPLNRNGGEQWFEEAYSHFGDALMLEIQPHDNHEQIEHNTKVINLANKYGLKIVAGTDSHYIEPEDKIVRDIALSAKGVSYGTEDNCILDYPDRNTLFERFKKQGLNENTINEAINNTLLFSETEGVVFDKEIKLPSLYSDEENMKADFLRICTENFKELIKDKTDEQKAIYKSEIQREIDVFNKGDMMSYPLLCHHIVKLGEGNPVEIEGVKYELDVEPSMITKTGRGSGASPLVHNLFGLTTLDRLDSEVPMLFERFISLDRLQSKVIPDLDINVVSQDAFLRAAKILLGEENAYFMYKEDSLQEASSIKLVAKYFGLGVQKAEEMVETYKKYMEQENKFEEQRYNTYLDLGIEKGAAKKRSKSERVKIWDRLELEEMEPDIYRYAERLFDKVIGLSCHPCGVVIWDGDIEANLGLVQMKNGAICASTTGFAVDEFKFLKLDLLMATTWKLIFNAFKNIGLDVPNTKELSKLFYDKRYYSRIMEIIENGKTATVCQFSTHNGKGKIMQYKPKTIGEMSDLSAGMRPGFQSLIGIFLLREAFAYGIPALDSLLSKTTGCKQPFVLYQEAAMMVMEKAGISLADGYVVLKAISKKKMDVIMSFKERFITGFNKYLHEITGEDNHGDVADKVWKILEDSSSYSFNASHSLSYSWDAAYALYCKAEGGDLMLSYFKATLDEARGSKDATTELLDELPFFGIKIENPMYGKCDTTYVADYENLTLYRALDSVDGIGEKTADGLIQFSNNNKFDSFIDFLIANKEDKSFSLNKTQIKKLILIDFFKPFGKIQKLLNIHDNFFENKEYKYGTSIKNEEKRNATIKSQLNKLMEMEANMPDEDIDPIMKIKYQLEILKISYDKIPDKKGLYIVYDIDGKWTKDVKAYNLETGQDEFFKYDSKIHKDRPLDKWQLIQPIQLELRPKKFVSGYDKNNKPIWEVDPVNKNKFLLKFHRKQLD